MSGERLVIRSGRLFDPGSGIDRVGDLVIVNGRIDGVAHDGSAEGQVVEAAGLLVVPGFVDLHAHLREPGFEQKGTIATETLAAMRGGFTTVCAMPNTEPAPDSEPVLRALWERIHADAAVRVFPIGCVTHERAGRQLAELSELADAGCVAFSDDGDPVADGRLMRSALELGDALGLPISEHADDRSLHDNGVAHEGRVSERLGLAGQPEAAEVSAIARDIALAEQTGGFLHIAHITTARGVELVRDAKARGIHITCEVTPSHLFLTEDAVAGYGAEPAYDTNARVNPPLRTEADRRALVAGVNSGVIDAIATDHAPHAIEDKLCEFDKAAPGISCFETALGSTMELVARGELELEKAVRALTVGPVAAWNLGRFESGLGSFASGAPGDVTLIDIAASWTVDTATFASRGKNSPLHGMTLRGRVVSVVVGGKLHNVEER